MFEPIIAWAADNAATSAVGVVILFMYRDLRTHMRDEKIRQDSFDEWRIDHLTGHP